MTDRQRLINIRDLLSPVEAEMLRYILERDGDVDVIRKQFRKWTDEQIAARCRNATEQANRRLSHETGACTRGRNFGEQDSYYEIY